MTGDLLMAIAQELIAQGWFKQVQIDRNFTTDNPPQNVLPAVVVNMLDDSSSIFVGGLERREYQIGLTVCFLDTNVDLKYNSQQIISKLKESYNIVDNVQTLFNVQKFKTKAMQSLQSENNLITRSRGYNKRHTPYDKWSKNVIMFELVIRAIVTVPQEQPTVPVETITYDYQITVK